MPARPSPPVIAYQDGFAALDRLARVFGFRELRGWRPATADSRTARGHRWMFMER